MAFPTSPSNNDVHKEGNRSFVHDSTLGVWDQVKETDRLSSESGGGVASLTTLGTVTSANLSHNDIVMPRFKEISQFHYPTHTQSTDTSANDINLCGSDYVSCTPEATGDLLEFTLNFGIYGSDGYIGWGVERADNTGFSTNRTTVWSTGRHIIGDWGGQGLTYSGSPASIVVTCSWATPDQIYYFRVIGMTHGVVGTWQWGTETTNDQNGVGIHFAVKRWSVV